MSRLEQQLSLLDASTVDTVLVKVNQLKTALNLITNAKSSKDTKFVEGIAAVRDLHSKFQSIYHMADEVALISQRLKTLELVHQTSSQLISQISNLEASTESLGLSLASNEQVLKGLQMVRLSNYIFFS